MRKFTEHPGHEVHEAEFVGERGLAADFNVCDCGANQ
jgi:hypothetical protein